MLLKKWNNLIKRNEINVKKILSFIVLRKKLVFIHSFNGFTFYVPQTTRTIKNDPNTQPHYYYYRTKCIKITTTMDLYIVCLYDNIPKQQVTRQQQIDD